MPDLPDRTGFPIRPSRWRFRHGSAIRWPCRHLGTVREVARHFTRPAEGRLEPSSLRTPTGTILSTTSACTFGAGRGSLRCQRRGHVGYGRRRSGARFLPANSARQEVHTPGTRNNRFGAERRVVCLRVDRDDGQLVRFCRRCRAAWIARRGKPGIAPVPATRDTGLAAWSSVLAVGDRRRQQAQRTMAYAFMRFCASAVVRPNDDARREESVAAGAHMG